jgi:hypothetical protein
LPYQGYDQGQHTAGGLPNPRYQDGHRVPNRPDAPHDAQVNQFLEQISDMMQRQFGLRPKNDGMHYRKPYLEYFDQVQLPHRYKIPDFTKFTGTDSVSTREHISRYIVQLGEATSVQELKVQLFPLSLSGSAFSWFSSLPQGSIGS